MALLKASPSYIAVAINTSIHVFARNKTAYFLCEHIYNSENLNVTDAVDFITFSPKYNYFIALFSDKSLVVWKTLESETSWQKQSQFSLNRRSTSVAFSPDETTLYVADKSGDLYNINVAALDNESEKTLKPILGHVSILLHVSVTEKYIITTDRDEKIRISLRDQPYNIHCFCLGHTDFVCNALLHENNCLISSSGDGTLRSWNIDSGSQTSVNNVIDAYFPDDSSLTKSENSVTKHSVPALLTNTKNSNLIAVGNVGINNNFIIIYCIDSTAQTFLKNCYQIKLDENESVVDICFDESDLNSSAILFTLTYSSEALKLKMFSCSNSQYHCVNNDALSFINSTLAALPVENPCQVNYLQLFKTTIPGYTYENFYKKKSSQFKKDKSLKRVKLL